MPYCSHCGAFLVSQDRYCGFCGRPVVLPGGMDIATDHSLGDNGAEPIFHDSFQPLSNTAGTGILCPQCGFTYTADHLQCPVCGLAAPQPLEPWSTQQQAPPFYPPTAPDYSGYPPYSIPGSPVPPYAKPRTRRPVGIIIVAVVLVLVFVGIAVASAVLITRQLTGQIGARPGSQPLIYVTQENELKFQTHKMKSPEIITSSFHWSADPLALFQDKQDSLDNSLGESQAFTKPLALKDLMTVSDDGQHLLYLNNYRLRGSSSGYLVAGELFVRSLVASKKGNNDRGQKISGNASLYFSFVENNQYILYLEAGGGLFLYDFEKSYQIDSDVDSILHVSADGQVLYTKQTADSREGAAAYEPYTVHHRDYAKVIAGAFIQEQTEFYSNPFFDSELPPPGDDSLLPDEYPDTEFFPYTPGEENEFYVNPQSEYGYEEDEDLYDDYDYDTYDFSTQAPFFYEKVDLYIATLSMKSSNRIKVDSQVVQIVDYTEDLSQLLYSVGSADASTPDLMDVYRFTREGKSKQSMAKGVFDLLDGDAETGKLYFTKRTSDKMAISDFVQDDMAMADETMALPDRMDYPDIASYQAALIPYSEKMDRDEIRHLLREHSSDISSMIFDLYELYYSDNGSADILEQNLWLPVFYSTDYGDSTKREDYVIYQKALISQMKKAKLSELDAAQLHSWSYWNQILELEWQFDLSLTAQGGTPTAFASLPDENSYLEYAWMTEDGLGVYYTLYQENPLATNIADMESWSLHYTPIQNGQAGESAMIDSGILPMPYRAQDDQVLFFKETAKGQYTIAQSRSGEKTTLFVDAADYDLSYYSSHGVLLAYKETGIGRTLYSVENTAAHAIGVNVLIGRLRQENNSFYCLSDSRSRQEGNLYLFSGEKEPVLVDTNVQWILEDGQEDLTSWSGLQTTLY
ncbi:hypothetical protein U6B65_02095 [Oscillospiraceae bacterium MB08-C2-2]|nr:hypothetical protein U6B65_02095 [Oscillospiraceae bacterium MB08-C2-2]